MFKKQKEYKVRTKRSLLFRFLSNLYRLIARKRKIINLGNEELKQQAIFVMNHSGAKGPLAFETFFPVTASPWSAHEMCGSYRMRWKYLYYVFYQQKLHWNKIKAFTVATLFSIVSGIIYSAIGAIGTHRDGRFFKTLKDSCMVLNEGIGIVIFPENSESGYDDKPSEFHKGFITLAKTYYKKSKIDLPTYNVYYSSKKRIFIVDKPIHINEMLLHGQENKLTVDDIAKMFVANSHRLYDEYVEQRNEIN